MMKINVTMKNINTIFEIANRKNKKFFLEEEQQCTSCNNYHILFDSNNDDNFELNKNYIIQAIRNGYDVQLLSINYDVYLRIIYYINECNECPIAVEQTQTPHMIYSYMKWSHGLSAYCGGKDVYDIYKKASCIYDNIYNTNMQICCADSTQHIGSIGLYIKGEVIGLSNTDLWSYIEDGVRKVSGKNYDYNMIVEPGDYDPTIAHHTEAIVIPNTIEGVWIKKWACDKDTLFECAFEIANYFNVAVEVV